MNINKTRDGVIETPTVIQVSYCAKLCFDAGLSYEYSMKRIQHLTKRECSILIAKLKKGAGMFDVFDFFQKTCAEILAQGGELL
ncbi:MAG: hypothetical protein WC955_05105 [Elusimicrobiota bacterium]